MRRLTENYLIPYLNPSSSKRETATKSPDQFFGNRASVLKPPGPRGERGVLFLMFSEMFQVISTGMRLDRLMQDYTLVFEPSWSGYCHPDLLRYAEFRDEVFISAAEDNDYTFLQRLQSNLVPIRIGPCDWVDPRVASPYLHAEKAFDVVMNSSWAAWKRHYVLFRALSKAKQKFKVLLIGGPWEGRTRSDVEEIAAFYGVLDQLTIKERLPYDEVMKLNCESRVAILLSLKEGSNRAIAESIFCDVPVIVLANHIGGIRKNLVPETGLLVKESQLIAAISTLMNSTLNPRKWGLEHISCFKSSETLNAILREHAIRRGEPWTVDIAGRSNSPESKYISREDAERLEPWNQGLRKYLKDA